MRIAEETPDGSGREGQIQALTRGIEMLELLVAAGGPISGVELSRRTGLHPSSVSRILGTLTSMGYARKSLGGYRVDYGVLNFVQAATSIDAIARAQLVIEALAESNKGCMVNLCTLRRGRVIYLVRSMAGHETVTATGLPLQQSSAAMRLLVTLGYEAGLAALRTSRQQHGWTGGPELPADEEAAMAWAIDHVDHDVLILQGWCGTSRSGAIPVESAETGYPMAVAIGGFDLRIDPLEFRLVLHDARRQVERTLWEHEAGIAQ